MDRKRWWWEFAIALFVFLIGAYGLFESLKMPTGDPHDSPGLTPAVLSAILMVLSAALMFYLLFIFKRNLKGWSLSESKGRNEGSREERLKTQRLVVFIALTVAYVALLGKIPYTLATFLYLVGSYLYFKSVKLHVAIGIALLVSLSLMYSFGHLLGVRLP